MTERKGENEASRTPEDVATLYSWANLHGAKYRDFSATRQEQRAQSRHRLLEEQDAMAAEAVRQAIADQQRDAQPSAPPPPVIEASPAEIIQTASTPQAPDAHAAEVEQPPQPLAPQAIAAPGIPAPVRQPQYASQRFADPLMPPPPQAAAQNNYPKPPAFTPAPKQFLPQSFAAPVYPQSHSNRPPTPQRGYEQPQPTQQILEQSPYPQAPAPQVQRPADHTQPAAPRAWYQQEAELQAAAQHPASDTLQQSRERVSSRWFALKGVFEQAQQYGQAQVERRREPRTPILAVFSLAGGVGKTSLVATLGRALSSHGERLLLADTTTYGLLPFYFGASEVRPGVVRNFAGENTDEMISLVSLDTDRQPGEGPDSDRVIDEIRRDARGSNRIILDMATASGFLTRQVLSMRPMVLVPVVPDMNSVVSLAALEGFFRKHEDATGQPLRAFYVLNQFDASLPLHLDVREVLRQQLGEQLLPFVLRRSAAVSEALAEGMTVIDYAPNSPITEDYLYLAEWIRGVSAPASLGAPGVRWSER